MSSKRANTSKLCKYSVCSPSSRTILPSFMEPQASLPSAAQPAVMDIRRLRRRLFEIFSYFKCESSIINRVGCGRMGHGDHHPTLICIPNNVSNHSRTGFLCPVLQQEARVFTPLSNGEGLGVGLSLQRGGGSRVAAGGRGFWPPCHNH